MAFGLPAYAASPRRFPSRRILVKVLSTDREVGLAEAAVKRGMSHASRPDVFRRSRAETRRCASVYAPVGISSGYRPPRCCCAAFAFLASRFSFNVFDAVFLSFAPPLSLLAMVPPAA